jgi:hypothetical protein
LAARLFRAGLDDAQQRHGRQRRKFVKDQVRRVRRQHREVHAGAGESAQRPEQIRDVAGMIVGGQPEAVLRVEAAEQTREA